MIQNLNKILLSPFTINLSFFSSLFFFASIVDMIAWICYGDPIFAFYFGLHGFVMCYVITLIAYFLKNVKGGAAYKIIFLGLGVVNAAIDIFCHYLVFTIKIIL